jgi:hypothetical protein
LTRLIESCGAAETLRQRLVVVHEKQDLTDPPRFLLTDALYWESGRVIETWSYRWTSTRLPPLC